MLLEQKSGQVVRRRTERQTLNLWTVSVTSVRASQHKDWTVLERRLCVPGQNRGGLLEDLRHVCDGT